jgi:hypothetical protein
LHEPLNKVIELFPLNMGVKSLLSDIAEVPVDQADVEEVSSGQKPKNHENDLCGAPGKREMGNGRHGQYDICSARKIVE